MAISGKGRADYYAPGDWNVQCFECGRKRKASTMKKHWQGYWVCPEHWEARHPQDFVRGVQDIQTPPWVQPMPADDFIDVCDLNSLCGVAGLGVAGCMVAGLVLPQAGIQPRPSGRWWGSNWWSKAWWGRHWWGVGQ